MMFLTPKQNRKRNAIVLVVDLFLLKKEFRNYLDSDQIITLWRGILLDYQVKFKELDEYASCFYTIPDEIEYAPDEQELISEMMTNFECLETTNLDNLFSTGKKLIEDKNFKQVTFISSLVPSIPSLVLRDVQEWLWDVEFVIGPDNLTGAYIVGYRKSETDELLNFSWQDKEFFISATEYIRSKGKMVQPIIIWRKIRNVFDLEYSYQFLASLSGINPKYNGFEGFNTWEAYNALTGGTSFKNSSNLPSFDESVKAPLRLLPKEDKDSTASGVQELDYEEKIKATQEIDRTDIEFEKEPAKINSLRPSIDSSKETDERYMTEPTELVTEATRIPGPYGTPPEPDKYGTLPVKTNSTAENNQATTDSTSEKEQEVIPIAPIEQIPFAPINPPPGMQNLEDAVSAIKIKGEKVSSSTDGIVSRSSGKGKSKAPKLPGKGVNTSKAPKPEKMEKTEKVEKEKKVTVGTDIKMKNKKDSDFEEIKTKRKSYRAPKLPPKSTANSDNENNQAEEDINKDD